MGTFIVRVFRDSVGADEELRGTVERPGGVPTPFHTAAELVAVLAGPDQPGSGKLDGSTPSSAIREA